MDFYKKSHFSLNRKLMILIGLWPYMNATKSMIVRNSVMMLLIAIFMPHLLSTIIHHKDFDRMMISSIVFMGIFTMFLKMVTLSIAKKDMKNLYDKVAENWRAIHDENEKKILVRYSNFGSFLTLLYLSSFTIAGGVVFMMPFLPKLLDLIIPLAEPRAKIYVGQGEYLILNREDHYMLLYIYDGITIFGLTTVTVATDSIYITCALQSCAFYNIVSQRLYALRPMGSDISSTNKTCSSYVWIIQIIQLHRTAVQFTLTLNQTFSLCFFFICVVNIGSLPLSSCSVLAHLDNFGIMMQHLIFLSALIIHLFIMFWPGQKILDHGQVLCKDSYDNEWYNLPRRTKKLFMIFILRSSDVPLLTAGGVLPLNYETYSNIMRTALSYVMVVASFRQTY